MFNLQKRKIGISAFPFLFTYQGVGWWLGWVGPENG